MSDPFDYRLAMARRTADRPWGGLGLDDRPRRLFAARRTRWRQTLLAFVAGVLALLVGGCLMVLHG